MAVITNNISGSSSGGSRIGITGSVIISNTSAPFPQPSSDTVFFVSGSENAKSVFGGAAKISGSLITDGNVQIGDSSNDTLTINASTVSIPNNLNFDSNTLYIDSTNNRIGIGKVPNVTLDVSGSLSTSGNDQPSAIFNGDTFISGAFGVSGIVSEVLSGSNSIGGTFVFDTTRQSIFYVNNATSNITANFTNVPTVDNRIISTTVILSQSTTARIVSAVQIAGVASTINWANNVTPTGNSGKQDVFGFNLIRSGSAWKTLGQMSTYG